MRKIAGVVVFAGVLVACGTAASDKKFEPTELQATQLKYLKSEAVLAKVGLEQAQQNFNTKFKALTDKAAEIKKDNKWGDAEFDPNELTFKVPAKPEPAKPEVKK